MLVLYILLGILALMLTMGVIAMIFFKLTIGKRDSWREPEETVYGAGERRALLLYQPSNGRHNVPQAVALAQWVADKGYTVTVNYPSEQLTYDPADYDLLLYGSAAYIGETSKALHNYIQAHPVTGKRVLLFVTGMEGKTSEVEALKLMLPEDNSVFGVKVTAKETTRLLEFAQLHIQ